jgi:hypothetical protein
MRQVIYSESVVGISLLQSSEQAAEINEKQRKAHSMCFKNSQPTRRPTGAVIVVVFN